MSFIRTALKAGIAKKLIDEARKPERQRQARDLVSKVRQRKQGRGGPTATGVPPR